jgi:hypothetical protein
LKVEAHWLHFCTNFNLKKKRIFGEQKKKRTKINPAIITCCRLIYLSRYTKKTIQHLLRANSANSTAGWFNES